MASREEMSLSFGAEARVYQAARPEYPAEAVRWMLESVLDGGAYIADVGAGTGKLTSAVRALGNVDVVAVDPDEKMLSELRRAVPNTATMVGTAEELPLPDAAKDAVVLGQAWHWVDPTKGSAEIGRVVKPGGVLGLIWNVRNSEVPWVSRLGDIMHASNAEIMIDEGGPTIEAPFERVESKTWTWNRPITRAGLLELARSRSYLITAAPDERARIEGELGVFFDELGLVGEKSIDLPYKTVAYRAFRAEA